MTSPEPAPSRGLNAQRVDLARRLAQGLADDAPLAELQAMQARLKLIDELMARDEAAARGPGRELKHHLVALAIVAALVSLAAWWPVSRTALTIEIDADAAQLTMGEAGALGGQAMGHELRAEGYSRLESGDATLARQAQAEGVNPIALRADRLALRSVSYGAGAQLSFEAGAPAARLAIEGAPHALALEFSGAVAVSLAGAPGERRDYPVAEWLNLRAEPPHTASAAWLTPPDHAGYAWLGLRPASLRLIARESGADGQVRLQSALRRAHLRLPAIERELTLQAGTELSLDGLLIDQSELRLGDAVSLTMSGSARHIGVRTGGFAQSLEPSWLEYAAHNHALATLWSAAGLLWGISSWLRRQWGEAT
jgi:hypothetical protein